MAVQQIGQVVLPYLHLQNLTFVSFDSASLVCVLHSVVIGDIPSGGGARRCPWETQTLRTF